MELKRTLENAGKAFIEKIGPGTGEQDILDTLKKEHEEVDAMLKQMVESKSAAEKKSLLRKIKLALVPHTQAEQVAVYDPIIALKDKEAKQDGEEGYLEHALASATLMQLEKITDASSPSFDAAAKVLKELVEHHVKEEERDVWALVRENFSMEQRAKMNRDFEAAKKTVQV